MQWLLFSYRVPSQPSALRVAVWRELRQHGAVGIGSGLYALPERAEYVELLERLTERVTQGGGLAVSFRAAALTEVDRATVDDAFGAARHEEYLQVIKSARKLAAHIAQEDDDGDYRFAEVESLEEELDKVRRQLARVVRRDLGGVAARSEAEAAVEAAAARLERYLENAYEGNEGATAADAPAPVEGRVTPMRRSAP
ncbi:MAG: Chromate resistance protein ChrB [Dehalococcoidia bacterium]